MHLGLPFNIISHLCSFRTEGWMPAGHGMQAYNWHLPDSSNSSGSSELSPHTFSRRANTKISWFPLPWTYPWVLLLHLFSVESCHFSSWCPDFEQFSELFTISFTILYKTLSRHFFITFNFLSSLSYFVTFPHWFADGSVMSQQIITHFLNEWISKLTKMENSLNAGVSKGLKLK